MLQKHNQVIVRHDPLFALQTDQDSLKTTVLCQRANAPLKPLLDYVWFNCRLWPLRHFDLGGSRRGWEFIRSNTIFTSRPTIKWLSRDHALARV